MTGAADAARVAKQLSNVADALTGVPMRRAMTKTGVAAKKEAVEVGRAVTGGSGVLSHMGRKGVRLGAGFDLLGDTRIAVNLRPPGAWRMMESGARPHTEPRRSRKKRLKLPQSYAATGREEAVYRSVEHPGMHGKRAIARAMGRISDRVPVVCARAMIEEVRRAWH